MFCFILLYHTQFSPHSPYSLALLYTAQLEFVCVHETTKNLNSKMRRENIDLRKESEFSMEIWFISFFFFTAFFSCKHIERP